MKGRTTLVLLAAIILVGTFIWIQEKWLARVPSKQHQRVKLFDLDPDTLISLHLKYTNTVVDCLRENDVWFSGGPDGGKGRADTALVLSLVANLNSMDRGTVITPKHLEIRGLDPSEYGFDDPLIEITAVDNKGRHVWAVGRKAPLGDMVYVMEGGGKDIFTVPGKLLSFLPSDAGQLRDHEIFGGEIAGVRRVEIRGPGGFIQILKDPEADWRLVQPVAAKADSVEVETYIQKLYRLRVEEFLADNVSDFSIYGLQGETKQISLGGSDGTSRMLVLGDTIPAREDYIYARRADDTSVFALKSGVLELLDVPIERFRDASILSLPVDEISSVSIVRDGKKLEMTIDESNVWKITTPMVCNADYAPVSDLVKLWSHAVIIEFDIAAPPKEEAEWIFEFGAASLNKTNRIEVLPADGRRDGLLIRRDGESPLYRINLIEMSGSLADPLHYKDKHVWRLKKEMIQRLVLNKAGQSRQVVERAEDGGFEVIGTSGNVRADFSHLERLTGLLANMTTLEYVTYTPLDLEIYGLANPSIELQIGFSGTNEIGRVLLVGRETPEGFYTMVKGRDVVFYLDKGLVDILSSDLVVEQDLPISNRE